jgi:hypothetical protein
MADLLLLLLLLLLQAAVAAGYGGSAAGSHERMLEATKTPEGSVDFFVELHIEQGPLLEQVSSCGNFPARIPLGSATHLLSPVALAVLCCSVVLVPLVGRGACMQGRL